MKKITTCTQSTLTIFIGFKNFGQPMHTWAIKETCVFRWDGKKMTAWDCTQQKLDTAEAIRRAIKAMQELGATESARKVDGATNGHIITWEVDW